MNKVELEIMANLVFDFKKDAFIKEAVEKRQSLEELKENLFLFLVANHPGGKKIIKTMGQSLYERLCF